MAQSSADNAESYTLGESEQVLELETAEENRRIATDMVSQARRTLCIVGRYLDPPVFNHADFCDAVTRLATEGRLSHVRALVNDSEPMVKQGHCLIELSRRLSSFIEIRRLGEHDRQFNEAFLIVDGRGYIHRRLSDRYNGEACFNDPRKARELNKVFQSLWDGSEIDPELRRLHI